MLEPDDSGSRGREIIHDLNNVFLIVMGHAELVANHQDLPAPVRRSVDEITKAGQRGAALVAELRELRKKAAAATSEVRHEPRAASAPVAEASFRRRLLYLDDDAPLVSLAVAVLTELGYAVTPFVRADEALAALRADARAFDMVVTDYSMPDMTGLDVAQQVARIRPDLPVLLMSGAVSDELAETCRRLAVCEVVEKPISIRELGAAVDAVARGTRRG